MKKFYAFLAAALFSLSAFAAINVVPSDEFLADFYDDGQVCMCFFVPAEINCNDIVVTGSFNGWTSNLASCIPAQALDDYDGWYVAAFDPEETPDATKGIQAKPIMLGGGGEFNWEYQVGGATPIRGGMQVVKGGYDGEVDLVNYGTDAPNVFTVDRWKTNPCTAIYHNYKFTVYNDGCDGYACPYIIGALTNWEFRQLVFDEEAYISQGIDRYTITIKAAENSPYQIVSGLWNEEGQIGTQPCWCDDAYMQKFNGTMWTRIPGEEGDNQLTHEDPNIVWDLRVEDLRWARCAPPEDAELVSFRIKLPTENLPEEGVEIIGTFDDWAGTPMTLGEDGFHFVELEAKASQFFKFRSAGAWPNDGGTELLVYDAENDAFNTIGDGQFIFGQLWTEGECAGVACKVIELDWSDPDYYMWKEREGQGIEEIILTEKARKVVVDGVLYIVRDNKLFNIQGVQVR